jgi:hypothetical protein
VPLKITFSIASDLKTDVFCSPKAHLIASTIFVFPQPFGPTIAVNPSENLNGVFWAKDLKPVMSTEDKYMLGYEVRE